MNSTTQNKKIYIVEQVIQETSDTKTLALKLEDGSLPQYVAGQFITIYFEESKTLEGKAYTFSSAPYESTCNITVKNIGEFSSRLCNLKKGDKVLASLPYGFFSSEYPTHELIIFAGGIGITPFRSIVLDTLKHNPNRIIHIHHSIQTSMDIVFQNKFNILMTHYPNVSITYYITKESQPPQSMIKGRMNLDSIIPTMNTSNEKEFLICGSISFVRDTWKGLKELGVNEQNIYTEAFFR